MAAYYNEFDPYAAAWLRNLIAAGHIAPGDVDERSILEVQSDDVRGYVQCHWFAGIGGWSLALRMAGWDDSRPVWTGSCPCQPFSAAGKQAGAADERDLWPVWASLIRDCLPVRVFGEQVEGAVGHGWLDRVRADMEAEGYALGAAVLGAHSVGAPHIRQRLWWVADAGSPRREMARDYQHESEAHAGRQANRPRSYGSSCRLADAHQEQWGRWPDCEGHHVHGPQAGWQQSDGIAQSGGDTGWLDYADEPGSQGRREHIGQHANQRASWAPGSWVPCADGKARRVEPSIQPLAHGVSNRVGRLRAYGNAIVPQVAAEFIGAVMECMP